MSEVTLGQGLISATVLGFLSSRIWERERERSSGGMLPQSAGLPVKHAAVFCRAEACSSFMSESLVIYGCVWGRGWKGESQKGGESKEGIEIFFSRGSEVYSVINTHETKYTEIPCSLSFWVHDSWEIWLLGELETWCFCWLAVNGQFNKIDYSGNISAVLPVIITLNTPR